MTTKLYSRNPYLEHKVKPIRLLFKFVGQQVKTDSKSKKIELNEIIKNIDTEEKNSLYLRFLPVQVELSTLINRIARLDENVKRLVNTLSNKDNKLSDKAKNDLAFLYYLAFKEAYVIATVFKSLGEVWKINEFIMLGSDYINGLEASISVLEAIDGIGLTYHKPLIENDDVTELKSSLRRIDVQAPLLLGYYNYFAQYEQLVRLEDE